ncbi:hypothetical protein FCM35_KLT16390 [Carex littledalei]|uniref:Uncharacterized protein n=1 Tax=Carex littledalei TaxID=544730 RepID=A0A833RCM1_9POAL|nr:hypothetical protein FCM35_KLT16390 [Carex littledalei]
MATEILRPQDCLRPPHSFYEPVTPPNRRRSRPVRSNQTQYTPSPNPKHARPNPKSNRKSSPSTSPPSTPLSTSPLKDGFRLLKRGEAFKSGQNGSDKVSPVKSKETSLIEKVEKTPPPQKKTQSDRSRHGSEPNRVGLYKELTFAGPVYACRAPEASCLPQPGLSLLLRSSSVGPTSDDEASRALRSLLKL